MPWKTVPERLGQKNAIPLCCLRQRGWRFLYSLKRGLIRCCLSGIRNIVNGDLSCCVADVKSSSGFIEVGLWILVILKWYQLARLARIGVDVDGGVILGIWIVFLYAECAVIFQFDILWVIIRIAAAVANVLWGAAFCLVAGTVSAVHA